MVKIHGSHGKCRRERDLYMNRECWCKFINMHQHCWGCCGQYNKTLHPEVIYQRSWNRSSRFLLVLIFFHPAIKLGEPCCPFQSKAAAALKQSHSTWRTLTKERHERGPICLLTTDFIPCVKGLLSVTFTWFKSLTQLNQKSMKSQIYFWVELSTFQVEYGHFCFVFFAFVCTCRATKKGRATGEHQRGWNLTTHGKILPIAIMGPCRNGKYTRKIQEKI